MSARSIRFQLIVWYAGLMTWVFVVLGGSTYVILMESLEGSLKESQLRRARQIAHSLLSLVAQKSDTYVREEIDLRYAPAANGRFVRVTRANGTVLYLSGAPPDRTFDPSQIPKPGWPLSHEHSRRELLPDGRTLMLASYAYQAPNGEGFLVEVGAPLDSVQTILRHFFLFLVVWLPVVVAVAVGGGYFLVKRALSPVDEITRTAHRISSHNLSERLSVAKTGDELERLSTALNHMITRIDDAFQNTKRFVADASHELRTPLTVLRGELEALMLDSTLTREQRDKIGCLLEEVERLANIVEGLFALSRLDAGEAQRECVPFDLGGLVVSTADQMALLAEDKKMSVSCDAPKGIIVAGDRARLKQVVVNLLDNAIKYTPKGGAVKLTVNAVNGHALIEVADNGIGIPLEAMPHIFERFFRVQEDRSRDLGGAGLGLSIVKSICAAHGGRVAVQSKPSHGSTFIVELPLATQKR